MVKYLLLHPSTITLIVDLLIILLLGIRVIMMRPATGVALAWLLLIAAFPFGGALVYLLIGERRIDGPPDVVARLARVWAKRGAIFAILKQTCNLFVLVSRLTLRVGL